MSERGFTYHHQDDVTGFCADYRHPHGCQDNTTPHTQENMTMDATDLTNRFQHHAPKTDSRAHSHEMMRKTMHRAAIDVDAHCPDGREKALAITKLEEAMFWANAAIARQQ